MSWFLYAFLAAFLYSCSIVSDTYLLTRQFKKISELSLTTAAALAGIPLLAVFLLFVRPFPTLKTMAYGLVAGWLLILAYQIYYVALRKADAALITTLFQLVLPFNFIIGVVFFDEKPTILQIVGLVIISVGSTLISLEQKEKKWKLRLDVLLLMAVASLLLSTSDAVFKNAAEDLPFMTLAISEYASSVFAGVLLYLLVPRIRKELHTLRTSFTSTFGMLQINEAFTLGGTLAIRYSLVIGPLALIQGVMGTQPLMVLLLTGALGLFGVKLYGSRKKRLPFRHLVLKISAIIIVCAGSALISGAANNL
jgi:drug/metabolite transporter (DMT)-like permease